MKLRASRTAESEIHDDEDHPDLHYHSEGVDDDYTDEDSGEEEEEIREDVEEEEDDDDLTDQEYVRVPGRGILDILDPSESASHLREPIGPPARRSVQRSKTTSSALPRGTDPRSRKTRPPPQRASSDIIEPPDPPEPSGRRAGGKARTRRRSPAERSQISMYEDDYPYAGNGRHPYYAPGWGRVGHSQPGPPTHSMSSSDAFDALYGDQNPFSVPPDPYYPPGGGNPRQNRMSMPIRGNELMSNPAYGYPGYGMHPGYGPPPWGYPPVHHTPSPALGSKKGAQMPEDKIATSDSGRSSVERLLLEMKAREEAREQSAARQAAEAKAKAEAVKIKIEEDKIAALTALILKTNQEQLEREKKADAARKAEADAKAALEAKALEDKERAVLKEKEIKAAQEMAKIEAEKEMAKKQEEEKEKWQKEYDDLKKSKETMEMLKKKFEAEAVSLRPADDMKQPPIRFKDAVGRKYTFPWHVCKNWKGMEALILQAFAHVDVIGKEVHAGHYDLVGPAGEIILPQVWETMAKPDMDIEMRMWPMPEKKQLAHHPHPPPPPPPGMSHADAIRRLMGDPGAGTRRVKTKVKSSAAHGHPPPPPPPPGSTIPMGPGHVPPPPPPQGVSPFMRDLLSGAGIPGPPPAPAASVVSDSTTGKKKSKKDGKKSSSSRSSKGFMQWAVGTAGPTRSSSTSRRRT